MSETWATHGTQAHHAIAAGMAIGDSTDYLAMLARVRVRAGFYTTEVPSLTSLVRVERIYHQTLRQRIVQVYGAKELS